MKEVAAALGLSPRTVETHKYQVMAGAGTPDHGRADPLRHRARPELRPARVAGSGGRRPHRDARLSSSPEAVRNSPNCAQSRPGTYILRVDRPRVVPASPRITRRVAAELRGLL